MNSGTVQNQLIDDIKRCQFCSKVTSTRDYITVHCTKYTGSQNPTPFDPRICSLCGVYKMHSR